MRIEALLLVTIALAGCATPAAVVETPDIAAPLSPKPGETFLLALDEPVWWEAPFVSSASGSCLAPTGEACFRYHLDVPLHAATLRVALDKPSHEDVWDFRVLDPSGAERHASDPLYSAEAIVRDPAPGKWTVELGALRASRSAPHLRALALSRELPAESTGLPNLRALPPWDIGFQLPTTPGALTPGVSGSLSPTTCGPEDWTKEGVRTRCLRFSFGWANTGEGIFDVRVGSPGSAGLTASATQRLHLAGGEVERAAGTATVHLAHGHYHLDDAYSVEAFRLDDGHESKAALSAKRGSCTADYLVFDWRSFRQDPAGASHSDCATAFGLVQATPAGGVRSNPFVGTIAMSRGWADVYPWDLADNYVDFSGQGDGRFLLRAQVDPMGHFAESDATDNSAYALILVRGDHVTVLERGFGTGPDDPARVLVETAWPSLLREGGLPR